jgi:hypothetical protein
LKVCCLLLQDPFSYSSVVWNVTVLKVCFKQEKEGPKLLRFNNADRLINKKLVIRKRKKKEKKNLISCNYEIY